MKIKLQYIQIAITVAILCLPMLVHAQPGFEDDVVDDVPIDGGLSLLLVAGVGYGAKKIRDKKNNNK